MLSTLELCLTMYSVLPESPGGHPSSMLGREPNSSGKQNSSLNWKTPTIAEGHDAGEAQPNKDPSGFSRKPYNAGN